MDTVLGLSMTPTTVGLVLVEGDGSDSSTRGHDAFGVRRGGFSPVTTSAFVAEALSRTQAIAQGQRLQAIRVTWSDDAAIEASLLLESLADMGFDNVVPIGLPEATEAFARGIGEVIGSDVTAVCVIESDTAIVLVVDGREAHDAPGSMVLTAVSDRLQCENDLIDWVSEVLERDGWQPDGLVLLGAGDGLNSIAGTLQGILGIPVFAPAEAELALARGAALTQSAPAKKRFWTKPKAPIAMLIGGILTFVVSASLAVGIELLPNRGVGNVETLDHHVVNTAETPTKLQAPVAPASVAPVPAAEAPQSEAQQSEALQTDSVQDQSTEPESSMLPDTAAQTMLESPAPENIPAAPAADVPAPADAPSQPVEIPPNG